MNPTYEEFRSQLTADLISIKGNSVNSSITGEYFVFYIDSTQLSQFKKSLYDQLLKYNTYSYVYEYFKNYILEFIGGGGIVPPSGSGLPPPPPTYKIQDKIIIG